MNNTFIIKVIRVRFGLVSLYLKRLLFEIRLKIINGVLDLYITTLLTFNELGLFYINSDEK
jgi:hypothetical protein